MSILLDHSAFLALFPTKSVHFERLTRLINLINWKLAGKIRATPQTAEDECRNPIE